MTPKPAYSMNVRQASLYTGIGKWVLRRAAYRGVLPYYKPGKAMVFKPEDLEAFVEKSKVVTPNVENL